MLNLAHESPRPVCRLPSQVHEHPGTFHEYAPRLSAAAPQLLSRAAQEADTGGTLLRALGPAASVVVRGCVQLIAWVRSLRPEPDSRADSGSTGLTEGNIETRKQQDMRWSQEPLTSALCQLLPGAEAGGLGHVSVQVGHLGAAAAECGAAGQQRDCCPVRLLLLSPPALCVPHPKAQCGGGARASSPDAGGGAAVVKLHVDSPVRQTGRVLALAEGTSAATEVPSSSSGKSQAPEQQQGLREQPQPPARLLCEVAVELVGGPQEVELALGAGKLAAAVGADGVGVLQLALVGPEHGTRELGEVGAGGEALQPLVHWVAPPLLLLPDAAAREVCGLWEQMKQEEEAEQGQAGAGGSAPPAGAREALAGAERQSSLWWSHLAPLLGDLAYVLGAGADDPDAQHVASQLLLYLYDNCAGELVGLVHRGSSGRQLRGTAAAAAHGYNTSGWKQQPQQGNSSQSA